MAIDLARHDLGLGDRQVGAVAVLVRDDRVAALRYAQTRSVPDVSIAPGVHEIAPETAAYTQHPTAAAVVLASEWLVGATTVPALELT